MKVWHLLLAGAGLAVVTYTAAVLSGLPLATLLLVGLLLLCPLMMLGMHRGARQQGAERRMRRSAADHGTEEPNHDVRRRSPLARHRRKV